MEGLNKLFESLFDVTLEPAGTGFGELWSPEVIKLVSLTGLAGLSLNKLFESLFDVTLKPATTGHAELWSPEVIKLVSLKKEG